MRIGPGVSFPMNNETTPTRPLKLSEMARALGVTGEWLRTECEAGRVPGLRAGRTYLFNREAVIRALSERAALKGVAR